VAEAPASGFGGLLRRLRADAGLTQDELAEAAQVSQRAISDLERGINLTARKDTARLLADALGLAGPDRARFEVAARGRAPAEAPAAGDGLAGGSAPLRNAQPAVASTAIKNRRSDRPSAQRCLAAGSYRGLVMCRLFHMPGPGAYCERGQLASRRLRDWPKRLVHWGGSGATLAVAAARDGLRIPGPAEGS